MNIKRLAASILALTFVFGGIALPNAVVGNTFISASAADALTYGDYEYHLTYKYGTVEIVKYNGTDEVVEIPSEIDGIAVTSIYRNAFSDNKTIKSVAIPDGVTDIGHDAFSGCDSLVEVTMTDSVETIAENAFISCGNLKSVKLSKGLTKIAEKTFMDCTNLTDIELPSGIKSIGKKAFRSCKNLEKINLPDGLKTIGNEAFFNCEKLVSISMPDSLTSMGYYNFFECYALKDVKLSANLTSMGSWCFEYCTSLKKLDIPASLNSIGTSSFTYNYRSTDENKEPSFTLNCYNGSVAVKHALASGVNFKIIDAENKTEFPEISEAKFAKVSRVNSTDYYQFRLNWTPVEGAKEYGVAVKLSGKWKVQVYTDKTTFTSPKIRKNSKYDLVICAKVNGKWETTDFTSRAFTVAVR
ncbi:MAG: leucine-rich repeat domain-containing protein [Ruminococcus sp.]|uniref:leucine-rich repeat domain-containing protein n=1 Tax=Ruminococcus sp. TaxID=41978 RepID=UPI0025DCA7B1|nr:leucine-rich repeat domain-containing protein [Ruminococcus sp.]MCR5542022.1 leucine-rich repeat domain-containing protein [Ruminococcus sp.]